MLSSYSERMCKTDRVGSGAVAECAVHRLKGSGQVMSGEAGCVPKRQRRSREGSVGAGIAQPPGTECPMWAKPGGVLDTSSQAASPAAW